ncbi:MAG TPA: prolipoprotein diacylglyceryl transferase [Stellaceae bacterium]|jgi:phosphatidylglycerol---prolipoprotein diacylglyceryl transferase|nr:prolipoprotein diacylglyceryl transferase [Stellaceae bacterium]
MLAIPYPVINPVALSLGPFVVRWYALAYIAGLVIGWRYCLWIASQPPRVARREDIDDFLMWATLGVILGGRTGYVLFYRPEFYFANPSEILKLWHGGMSFHGGALGVLVAIWLFTRQRKMNYLAFADIIAPAVPIGLFFGRIANFINDELWGRVTDVPWAMVFPSDPAHLPRHPSQLYEATLEGLVLFAILFFVMRKTDARQRPGTLSGTFLIGYGVARIIGECFRQPDANLGFIFWGVTMGQILSVPVLLFGISLLWWARRQPKQA